MIQELEIPRNDPLIIHFKKLFEAQSFEPERTNVVKIVEKKSWFCCKKRIIDKELPTYVNQIRNIMKDFESDDEVNVVMCYGNTNDTITYKKDICSADSDKRAVNVCVVYVDIACEGGELVFYKDSEPFKTITPNSCKVVMFEGSVYHRRNDYSKGHRLWVLFQFHKK